MSEFGARWPSVVGRRLAEGAIWSASYDPCVMRAVALLEQHGFAPPDVTRASVRALPDAEAKASARRQWISVAADGQAYEQALKGDVLFLAAVLLHEAAHLDGAGERTAYELELAFLQLADANQELIEKVERIRDEALGPAAHRREPANPQHGAPHPARSVR